MHNQYKLVNTLTGETLTTSNDQIKFGGPWGDLQADGVAVWQENTLTKAEQYAEINQQYAAEIDGIREAIRLMLDAGKDATALRSRLVAKQAEYKAALLGVV